MRDLKTAPPSPSADAGAAKNVRGMNPLFLGIIIGLLMGVALAVGFAIWLNRANNPFIEKNKPVEALPTVTGRPPTVAAQSVNAAKGDAEKPRFEFYQILPGEKGDKNDKTDKAEKAVKPAASATTPDAGEKPSPNTPTPREPVIVAKQTGGDIFMLQAGAFQNRTDAENMRAKVAFAGFEASIRSVNLPDKGTLYRVRLGPYKSQDEVNRIKSALSQGGIDAAIVRGTD